MGVVGARAVRVRLVAVVVADVLLARDDLLAAVPDDRDAAQGGRQRDLYCVEQLPDERTKVPKFLTAKPETFSVPAPLNWNTLAPAS
ncbi:hypothetical protein [Streptomyces coelicoflavus]|uniref:hypothetical protein n=1 Tax=Streptomyces coelicoflavus TaxID=285562 RepID=UPI003F4A7F30